MQKPKNIGSQFEKLCETIAALRHPVTGCPWDLEQTHGTLRKYMIEEAYEAAEVMSPAQPALLKDELGDVLLQVVLNSQLALDQGDFSIVDVIKNLDDKMHRRHPHVFGDAEERKERGKDAIREKWDTVKKSEKAVSKTTKEGVFDSLKPGTVTPAMQMAVAIGKVAKKIQFDWNDAKQVMEQFKSEVQELDHEILRSHSREKIYAELGDVFFSLGQLCRHLNIDPEICAMDGNRKFLKRFKSLEDIAKSEGLDVTNCSTETLEQLWLAAKKKEKN